MKPWIKTACGWVLVRCMPARARDIARAGITLPPAGREDGLVERLIRHGLATEACARKDYAALSGFHANYWRGPEARRHHESTRGRFHDDILPALREDLAALEAILGQRPDCTTLCEIGTGPGLALRYLAQRFPRLPRLIGIDLSEDMIRDNIQANADARIAYASGDALDWLRRHGGPHWCFFTNGGVLEYFSPASLKALLGAIQGSLRPAILFLAEPLAPDFDLATETDSRPGGSEFSFSHNYPDLLRGAGFEILHLRETTVVGARIVVVCAITT